MRIGVGTVGDHAVLEVADEGPGLMPEQSGRIFERFYRADTSRNRATGGAGLGLSIVQSLVTAHAGHVVIESTPGQGATFRILLQDSPISRRRPGRLNQRRSRYDRHTRVPASAGPVDAFHQAAGRMRPDS